MGAEQGSGATELTLAGAPAQQGRLRAIAGKLGWGHRGFRADRRGANITLLAILLLPFLLDQYALQIRMREHLPDLKRWLGVTQTLINDPAAPIYSQALHPDYLYPPFFLAFFWPLAMLPGWAAAVVFATVKWAALFVALRCVWRLCAPPDEDLPPIVALGSLLLAWRFFWNDFGQGNINLFILAAIALGCWMLQRGMMLKAGGVRAERLPQNTQRWGVRAGRPHSPGFHSPAARWQFGAGFAVMVAACTKVTPALVLVYFVYKRCWWTMLGAAAAGFVCLVLWPSLWLGWENNWRLLWDWYDHVIEGYLSRGAVYSIQTNQSLTGILNRLLGSHVALHKPDAYLAPVVLSPETLNALRSAVALAILGLLAWVCRGRLPERRRPLEFTAEISLVLVAMLTLSGYSWKMHFVTLIFPFAAVLAYLADARYPDRPRRPLAVLLILASLLLIASGDLLTPRGADYAEAFGAILWGAWLLGAAAVLIRERLRIAETP